MTIGEIRELCRGLKYTQTVLEHLSNTDIESVNDYYDDLMTGAERLEEAQCVIYQLLDTVKVI